MRMSKLFGRTLREVPAAAEVTSHQLALRAGLKKRNESVPRLIPLSELDAVLARLAAG